MKSPSLSPGLQFSGGTNPVRLFFATVLVVLGVATMARGTANRLNLDISNSFTMTSPYSYSDSGVSPGSGADAVTAAIQARLDWSGGLTALGFVNTFSSKPARIYLPANASPWTIDRPLFMNGSQQQLVGAGPASTTLAPATGYGAMSMIFHAETANYAETPITTANRQSATGVLDSSVGTRYGVRTYTEYPYTNFPASNHDSLLVDAWRVGAVYAVAQKAYYTDNFVYTCQTANTSTTGNAPGTSYWVKETNDSGTSYVQPWWTNSTAYAVGDLVSSGNAYYYCVQAHTSDAPGITVNQPFGGSNWTTYWVARVASTIAFNGDPFNGGAYSSTAHRGAGWDQMSKFTLDYTFYNNEGAYTFVNFNSLALCNGTSYGNLTWLLQQQGNGEGWVMNYYYNVVDSSGNTSFRSLQIMPDGRAVGLYRVVVQMDFTTGTVQSWCLLPGATAWIHNSDNTIGTGSHFLYLTDSTLTVGGKDASSNSLTNPGKYPIDITVFGLHMAAGLRYQDDGTANHVPVQIGTGTVVNDAYRYFTNDADHSTMEYLTLTDNPSTTPAGPTDVYRTGTLVTTQLGDASVATAGTGQMGFGLLAPSRNAVYYWGGQRVSDMKIAPGPTWGNGITVCAGLSPLFDNLDIEGGYEAISNVRFVSTYLTQLTNSTLSGSHAAFYGAASIVYSNNLNIPHCGRYGILLDGVSMQGANITFGDPVTDQTEYYMRGDATVGYSAGYFFDNVTGLASSGSGYPSLGAFSTQMNAAGVAGYTRLHNCLVSNMGANASFLQQNAVLPIYGLPEFATLMQGCSYSGSTIANFISGDGNDLFGRFYDCNPGMAVTNWNNTTLNSGYTTFDPAPSGGVAYDGGWSTVQYDGIAYRCIISYTETSGTPNTPGTAAGLAYWRPDGMLAYLYQETPSAPDTTKGWQIDRHIITLLNQSSGSSTEDRCVATPSTFAGIKAATGSAPSISVKSPDLADVAVGDFVTLSATVYDPDSTTSSSDVDHVNFYLDGSTVPIGRAECCDMPSTIASPATLGCQWQYDGQPHTLTATAVDKEGNTASASGGIMPTSGMVAWWRADSINGLADGAAVSTWADSSGNNNTAAQTASTNEAVYKVAGINNQPSLHFSGNQWFTTPLVGNFNDFSVIVVYKDDGTASFAERLVDTDWATGMEMGRYGSTPNSWFTSVTTNTATVSMVDTVPHIMAGIRSGTTVTTVADGITTGTATCGSGQLPATFNLFIGCNNADSCCLGGDIAEILVYNRALSTTERQDVEAYLTCKYHLVPQSGLVTWVSADHISGATDGTPIATWSDLSNAGNNATQSTSTNQPIYKSGTNGINSVPVLRFSGSQWFTSALTGNFNDFTAIAVYRDNGVVTQSERILDTYWVSGFELDRYGGYAGYPANEWGLGVTEQYATLTLTDGNPHVLSGIRSGTNVLAYGDSNQFASTTASTGALVSYPVLIGTNHEGTCPMVGDIAEVLIWNRALTTAERNQVETYLHSKYGF